jgi:HAD superfamily hydrolase (TIGR01484 family)
MAIKLIIFDVDDTLAPPNMPINRSVTEVLKKLETRGIRICMISGKPVSYLSGLARQLGLQEPILSGENGAMVYYSKNFPPKQSLVVTAVEEGKVLEELKSSIIRDYGDTVWIQPNQFNLTIFPRTEKTKTDLFQYVTDRSTELSAEGFKVYRHSDSIEVVSSKIDKGAALRKIRTLEKLGKDEVVAVGDGENDIPMFSEAGISIGIKMTGASYSFSNIKEAIRFIRELIEEQ